jgi:uncharacterized membrane protein YdjX (TVP38/TMEM64 family)
MSTEPQTAPPVRLSAAWQRGLVLLLLCGALVLIVSSDALHGWLMRLLAAGGELIGERPVLGAAVFVVLSALSAMLAFFSTAVLVPVALSTWGKALTLLLLWLGWTLGGVTAYTIGRFLGRPVVTVFLAEATVSRFEERISKRTPFSLVLLFQLALPSEIPGYVLGLVRYRFWWYLASLMLAELPYAVGTLYLGASFLDRQPLMLVALGVAGATLMAAAIFALRKRLRSP